MKAQSRTTEVRWTMLEMEAYHIACHSHDIAEALQNKRMEPQPILYYIILYIYMCYIYLSI